MDVSDISPFMPRFEVFRDELDEHHDRRERIIKASRDITALSKKIIFSLQRVCQLQTPIPPPIAKEIKPRYDNVKELFISVAPDLQGINAWRYRGQISGGCQEFVEAISFQHYLETQKLITLSETQSHIPGGIELTANDYLLGIYDLTGELMRFGITSMATTGVMPRGMGSESEDLLADLRLLRASLESLDISSSTKQKVEVMRQSVDKVENAACSMIIRGRERPKGWVPELSEGRRERVESY